MSKILIFDFEVFKYNTLLGVKILDGENYSYFQTWNLLDMKRFFYLSENNLWVGHNNMSYDNHIMDAILNDEKNIYNVNNKVINDKYSKYKKLKNNFIYYDLMSEDFYSLKVTEAFIGKNISESGVPFDIDRELTEEEKKEVEAYNRDDLDQTHYNFNLKRPEVHLRLAQIKEFNLDLSCLTITGTQLAAAVLKAKANPELKNKYVAPKLYENLQVNNKEALNFYLTEKFRTKGSFLEFSLCDVTHRMGAGGLHGAVKKCYVKKALYLDVSGYYNLVMLLYGLLPRTIPEEGKKLYEHMYYEQLTLKGVDDIKRSAYKTILLSVFGAAINENTDFYDPWHGLLVTLTGQLFLIDLLEKFEGKIKLIQSNTDGIIVVPLDWSKENEILNILKEWMDRTGFVIKPKYIFDVYQRDVNNYFYRTENGDIHLVGNTKQYCDYEKEMFLRKLYDSKDPAIIATGVVEYFMFNKNPEQIVDENKGNLRMFQYICKENSYDWLDYETTNLLTGEVKYEKLQKVNRAFALKSDEIIGMVKKRKYNGKNDKYQNLPDNVFVWNNEILSNEIKQTFSEIDIVNYDFYVKQIKERILEFINIPTIKDLKL